MDMTATKTGTRRVGRHWHKGLIAVLILVAAASLSCGRRTAPASSAFAAVEPDPVPPPAPAPTITLTATVTEIESGGRSTLRWETTNAGTVSLDNGIGAVDANGSREVSPAASTTFTATATGPGGTARAAVRITVNRPPEAAPPAPRTPDPTIEELFSRNMQSILFDFDRAEVRPSEVRKIQSNARFLRENAGVQFTIGGHADERGSQEYNIGLGDRRANAVRQALLDEGIAVSRIQTVSYGEERPRCTQASESCWQENRRADFALR